jgi:type II secretory pathway component GspD/PulD (secretin)
VCLLALGLAAAPQQRPAQMPVLPLTQLDERALAADLDSRTLTLTFPQPAPVKDALLQIVRGTSLSIVPDPSITETFVGELKNVTVRQALALMLRPIGLDFSVDGGFIRVFRVSRETRIFDVNYVANDRMGQSTVAGDGAGRSRAEITTTSKNDLFADLAKGVQSLLSDRATFNVDRKAGLIQVTDFPERLDRVSVYLDAVQDRVHRQVQIAARAIEVELSDEHAQGIDWSAAAAAGATATRQRALTGLRVTDVSKLLAALDAQGTVTTVASPTLLTVNNEPAIVRTDALTVSVTPQIGDDGILMLDVAPIVAGARTPGAGKAPSVAEAEMLARVVDGETLVVSGFTREYETKERKNVGISGGWFGRSTVVTKHRVELVILLTPRLVPGSAAQ